MSSASWLDWFSEDPLAGYAVFRDSASIIKLGSVMGLPYFHLHLHEMLIGFAFFTFVYYITGPVLRCTCNWYSPLNDSLRSGVATHVVSQANALLMLILSFPLFFIPELYTPHQRVAELAKNGPVSKEEALAVGIASIVAYQPYGVFVVSLITGYFMFDVYITFMRLEDIGIGFAIHAIAALFTFAQGCRPYMLSFAAPFLWYEASTPFVNVHWLATNVPGIISPKYETINGAILMLVFFICRIIAGTLNGYQLFEIALFHDLPGVSRIVVYTSFTGYMLLSSLNFFWFGKMINVAIDVLFKKPAAAAVQQQPEDEHLLQSHSSVSAGTESNVQQRQI